MMGGNYYSQSGEQRNSWTFDCSKQTVVNPDGHNYEMLLNGKSRTISCEPGAFDSDEEIENCIENSRYMFFKDGVNWDDCDTDVGSELTASRRYGEKVYNGKFSCYFK